MTHAFYSVVQVSKHHGVPAEAALAIVEDLARYAGPSGMVGGRLLIWKGSRG